MAISYGSSPVTVKTLCSTHNVLLPGVFDIARLDFLPFFDHIRRLFDDFTTATPEDQFKGFLALVVVAGNSERLEFRLPVIAASRTMSNKFKNKIETVFEPGGCLAAFLLTALMTHQISRSESPPQMDEFLRPPGKNHTPQKLKNFRTPILTQFRTDWARWKNDESTSWLKCHNVRTTYTHLWEPPDESMNEQYLEQFHHWCHPLPLYCEPVRGEGEKRGIPAALAIDAMQITDAAEKRLEHLLSTVDQILGASYLAFASQLDFYSEISIPRDWKWAASGRVRSPAYLQALENAIEKAPPRERGRRRFRSRKRSSVPYFRYWKPLWSLQRALIFYCDGNNIKRLNDSYSHKVGNEVIKLYGGVLLEAARVTALKYNGSIFSSEQVFGYEVVRWGGDEYVVIFAIKGTFKNKSRHRRFAEDFADEVRNALGQGLGELTSRLKNADDEKVSKAGETDLAKECGLAIGWAAWDRNEPDTPFRSLWQIKCEEAMYASKESMKFYKLLRRRSTSVGPDIEEKDRLLTAASLMAYDDISAFEDTIRSGLLKGPSGT